MSEKHSEESVGNEKITGRDWSTISPVKVALVIAGGYLLLRILASIVGNM